MKKHEYGMIMKTFTALITSAIIFTGCTSNEPQISNEPQSSNKTQSENANTEASISTETDAPEITAEMRDIPSVELVKEFSRGYNLGNTLDATGGAGLNTETSWGNPKTTEEMIVEVKNKGFDIIRIPTTWHGHLGAAPDYTIDENWMNRIKEVVDYAINNDLYVILNTHHEEWLYPTLEKQDELTEELCAIWTQIAKVFENYSEKLIFEGMNEPRLRGTNLEWNGGDDESRGVVNHLNKAFVDTIRKSGGNNPLRHLMIPAYAASSDEAPLLALEVPDDDKVIVSVHSYTPYEFALADGGRGIWRADIEQFTQPIDAVMERIERIFLDKNIAVIIGETGARTKDNVESRVLWADYFFGSAAKIGVPAIWWDNGGFGLKGEGFGLFNRKTFEWVYPEIVDAINSAVDAKMPLKLEPEVE